MKYFSGSSSEYSIQRRDQDNAQQKSTSSQDPIIEVISPGNYGSYGPSGPFSGIWSRTLRIKITGRDGYERLDVRIPVSLHVFSYY